MLSSGFLLRWRRRAMRAGVWFKALTAEERGIMVLAPMVVERVKSPTLARIIVEIVKKIRDALDGGLARSLAQAISRSIRIAYLAVIWGHKEAASWALDDGFVRYLAILDLNAPSGWGF
ncbi:hypothetical protein KEJ49_02645 [Candidatus Bathyarchaeota archaeon]|nr:hypothetical protein [Candidatus Bathyarchaeota archaeon]